MPLLQMAVTAPPPQKIHSIVVERSDMGRRLSFCNGCHLGLPRKCRTKSLIQYWRFGCSWLHGGQCQDSAKQAKRLGQHHFEISNSNYQRKWFSQVGGDVRVSRKPQGSAARTCPSHLTAPLQRTCPPGRDLDLQSLSYVRIRSVSGSEG